MPTLNAKVHQQLRADILKGRLVPGQRLKLAELSTMFGASHSVIREALTRLTEQGLVAEKSQQGFKVAQLSFEDLTDLTRVRIDIEGLALRRAIENGDLAWEASVIAAHHTLEHTPIPVDFELDNEVNDTWMRVHGNFHNTLIGGCGSPRLSEIAASVREAASFYRRWSRPLDADRDIRGEHRAILDAAVARDADNAVKILAIHIQRTTNVILTFPGQSEAGETEEGDGEEEG